MSTKRLATAIRAWLKFGAVLFASITYADPPPYYHIGDVADFSAQREDSPSCLWDISWGNFPGLRGPYDELRFSLERYYLGPPWSVYTRTSPPFNGNSIRPNMCVIGKPYSTWRIVVHAKGGLIFVDEETSQVSYLTTTDSSLCH